MFRPSIFIATVYVLLIFGSKYIFYCESDFYSVFCVDFSPLSVSLLAL